MFDRSSAHRHKEVLPVRIAVSGQEPFDASVFVKVDERLSDLLNDPRPFLPVRREDGSVLMVAKSSIASIIERELSDEDRAKLAAATAAPEQDDEIRRAEEEALQARAAEEVRRRAADLERLRREIDAKRAAGAAAKAAAENAAADQARTAQDETETARQSGPESGSDETSSEHGASGGPSGGPQAERGDQAARPNRPRRAFDPYAMLRVARGASVEEIKRAYKTRIKAVHPDMIASLDLDEDVVRAMHLTAQRINQAYDRIMRELARAEEQAAAEASPEQGAA